MLNNSLADISLQLHETGDTSMSIAQSQIKSIIISVSVSIDFLDNVERYKVLWSRPRSKNVFVHVKNL